MTDDIRDDPEFQEWERSVQTDLVPKLRQSAYTMCLVPDGEPDAKVAVELGMMILLDKPIIAVVRAGTRIPRHLARVADQICEADLDTEVGRADLAGRINSYMAPKGG
jgi:hypothetical protein